MKVENNNAIVACCFRSIHDFIVLTKNNNIDLGLRPQVHIVILGQCDKIMHRPHQHAIIVYYQVTNVI